MLLSCQLWKLLDRLQEDACQIGARSEKPSALGACGDVVWRLCECLRDKGHKVYFDNLFNSYHLLMQLQTSNIHAVGMCRTNRLLGADSALKPVNQLKKAGRGAISVATSDANITGEDSAICSKGIKHPHGWS